MLVFLFFFEKIFLFLILVCYNILRVRIVCKGDTSMNNENLMGFVEDNNYVNNFDFSGDWENSKNTSFVNLDEEDDIIISNENKNDVFSFSSDLGLDSILDDEFEEEKLLNIINDDDEFIELKEDKTSTDFDVKSETELDSFFDSIYNGVEDANDLISQINLKKKTLSETEKEIANLKEQIAREKEEFKRYMDSQRQALEMERQQLKEKAELQRMRLTEESAQYKSEVEVKNNELELREQKLKVEQEKLEMQKVNFSKYKEVEDEKIQNGFNKLNIEKEQLDKERELAMQTIENNKKEFEIEKEHFEKIKQIEESKLESERNNLSQNCERFKRLISGLSTNFNNMPNE